MEITGVICLSHRLSSILGLSSVDARDPQSDGSGSDNLVDGAVLLRITPRRKQPAQPPELSGECALSRETRFSGGVLRARAQFSIL